MTAQLIDASLTAPARPRLLAVSAAPLGPAPRVARPVGLRPPVDARDAQWVAQAVARVQGSGASAGAGDEWAQPVRVGGVTGHAADVAQDPSWQLTPRGLAVSIVVTLAVMMFMLSTVVSAFLAVSAEPPAGHGAPSAYVLSGGATHG